QVSDLLTSGRVLVDFAAQHNLPFLIHSSIASYDGWSQAADILRVAEQNPQVRFCLAHSCRFDEPSLDRVAELPNTWFDISAHGIHCHAAVRNLPIVATRPRRFASDYENPATVLRDLADRYPRKLLWGTDSPFYSFISEKFSM